MLRVLILLMLTVALLVSLSPASGQETTGLIVEGNLRGEAGIGSLNPLLCDNPSCRRITGLLFPMLFRVDASSQLVPATETDGLAESWELDGNMLTVHLRTDRLWSDGTPITAYDVYFSYLAIDSEDIQTAYYWRLEDLVEAVAPIEDYTIAFVLNEPNCADISTLNFPVIPAHVYDSNFTASAQFSGGDIAAWQAMTQPERDFSGMVSDSSSTAPSVTSGPYQLEERRYGEYVRLISPDGGRAFAYVDVPDRNTQVDRFIRGDLDLLVDPPYERIHDLEAADEVQVAELPGRISLFVGLNLADPLHPRNTFDEDGNLLDQGYHPIFSDPQVRHALQMAIDVPALIDAAAEGHGVPIASTEPPALWSFNSDLAPVEYNPMEAARLLEAAGWKDTNRDGVRECISCTYATHGAVLSFELIYFDDTQYPAQPDGLLMSMGPVANLISQQLYRVGVRVGVTPDPDLVKVFQQQFDAYIVASLNGLISFSEGDSFLTPAGDVVFGEGEGGFNFSSYANPEVTDLFQPALHAPHCSIDTRRAAYEEIQAILQQDQPFLYLFSPNRVIATRGSATTLVPEIQEMLLR